jgi:hypothetical protein
MLIINGKIVTPQFVIMISDTKTKKVLLFSINFFSFLPRLTYLTHLPISQTTFCILLTISLFSIFSLFVHFLLLNLSPQWKHKKLGLSLKLEFDQQIFSAIRNRDCSSD